MILRNIQTMQSIQHSMTSPMTPRPMATIATFDSVAGINLCGGISRMDDDAGSGYQIECPSPKTAERRKRRAAAYAKFQSDAAAAAKSIWQRRKYSTSISYTPATNANQLIRLAAASAAASAAAAAAAATNAPHTPPTSPSDITPEQVPILVHDLQLLNIRLIIDSPMTVDELRALCEETSRAEAVAYAAAESAAAAASLQSRADTEADTEPNPLKIKYEFTKRTRIEFEAELQRCQKRQFGGNRVMPTSHARIASSVHRRPLWWIKIGHVISLDTLTRTFVSVNALAHSICADIREFLTSPSRGRDRVAFVALATQ